MSFIKRPQQFIPPNVKNYAYPTLSVDNSLIEDFYGKLLSGNIGEIQDFITQKHPTLSVGLNGQTPIHIILSMDDNKINNIEKYNIIELLIRHGASVNAYSSNDIAPLHVAVAKGYTNIAELLLKNGANVNITNGLGQNALHYAVLPVSILCPSMIPETITKQKMDIKNINVITRAVMQFLSDVMKIYDKNNTNNLPLQAIKDIINNSYTYITNRDYYEDTTKAHMEFYPNEQKDKFLSDVQKIRSDNTIKEATRNTKIKYLVNDQIAIMKKKLIDYYGVANQLLSFKDNRLFMEQNLTCINTKDKKDIFSSTNLSYFDTLNEILKQIDVKYMALIKHLKKSFEEIVSIIDAIGGWFDWVTNGLIKEVNDDADNDGDDSGAAKKRLGLLNENAAIINKSSDTYNYRYAKALIDIKTKVNEFVENIQTNDSYYLYVYLSTFNESVGSLITKSHFYIEELLTTKIFNSVNDPISDNTNRIKTSNNMAIKKYAEIHNDLNKIIGLLNLHQNTSIIIELITQIHLSHDGSTNVDNYRVSNSKHIQMVMKPLQRVREGTLKEENGKFIYVPMSLPNQSQPNIVQSFWFLQGKGKGKGHDDFVQDLPNTYLNDYGLDSDLAKSYLEILTTFKRIYICAAMNKRRVLFPIKPSNAKDKITDENLYDYIKNILKKQLDIPDMKDYDLEILTNKTIAVSIDEIITKSIESNINIAANILFKQIMQKDMPNINPVSDQYNQTNTFAISIDMNDLNDTFESLINNYDDKADQIINLIKTDIINVETTTELIGPNSYEYVFPNGKKDNLTIFYSSDYVKYDSTIMSKKGLQCMKNNTDNIKLLLRYNIATNHTDYYKKTPIMYAIEANDTKVVELLQKNRMGMFPKDMSGNSLIQFLEKHELNNQNILLYNNSLNLSDRYNLMLKNIFEVDKDLKQLIPRNLEILGYMPIYIFNWLIRSYMYKTDTGFKTDNTDNDQQIIKKLYNKYNVPNESDEPILNNNYLRHENLNKQYNNVIDEYKKKRTFSSVTEKINMTTKKQKDYDKIMELSDNEPDKNEQTMQYIEKNIIGMKSAYNDTNDLFDELQPFDKEFEDAFNALKDDENDFYAKYYIFGKIITKYHESKPWKLSENIHLITTFVYKQILIQIDKAMKNNNIIELQECIKDLEQIKIIINKINTFLYTRFEKNNNVQYIVNTCIKIPILLVIQNSINATIKKLIVQSLFERGINNTNVNSANTVVKTKNIDHDAINAISIKIMKKLIGNDGILELKSTDNTLTSRYVDFIINTDPTNELEDYNSLIQTIIKVLTTGEYPLNGNALSLLESDILPHYQYLYVELIKIVRDLTTNYIKFINNQSSGIQNCYNILSSVFPVARNN